MPYALNKKTSVTAASGTSIAANFTALPAAGDLIVITVSFFRSGATPTIATMVDNQGNIYSLAAETAAFAPANNKVAIYYCANIGSPSGTHTVTVTFAASHDVVLCAASYSGGATSSILRGTPATATANATSVDASVTSDANPVSGDLLVAAASAGIASSANVHFLGATSGYTNLALSQDYTSFNSLAADYKLAAGGAESANWSHDATSGGNDGWGAVISCFKPAAAGASPTYPQLEHANGRGSFRGMALGMR